MAMAIELGEQTGGTGVCAAMPASSGVTLSPSPTCRGGEEAADSRQSVRDCTEDDGATLSQVVDECWRRGS